MGAATASSTLSSSVASLRSLALVFWVFGINFSEKIFETHKELDVFVNFLKEEYYKYQEIYKPLEEEFKEEYEFLKLIDRLFWIKHMTFPSLKRFEPLPNDIDEFTTQW